MYSDTHTSPAYPSDIFVDGFLATTFTPRDAGNYLTHLLNGHHSQVPLVQLYGITYSNGAWYITQNLQSVQQPTPGVTGIPSPPLLDFRVDTTAGSVVRQRRWHPANEVDVRRHIEDAALQLPVFFVSHDGTLGYRLQDILQNTEYHLRNGYQPAPLGGRTTTHIRIGWQGYPDWRRQIPARDETSERRPITLSRFMKYIATSVDKFFRDNGVQDPAEPGQPWAIGQGGVTQNDVKIIGAVHISAGCWMPILQLTTYVFWNEDE
ncbi:hypothetical protein BC834DRAFT_549127 [Gloeopeniophorella convolvens]|nr:hypothetical protein BC834DRAFT_549127 [Gloeopeniophorella convolvens]